MRGVEAFGVVMALRYLGKPGLVDEIANLLKGFMGIISSIQQIYVEEKKMLDVSSTAGEGKMLKRMAQELMARRKLNRLRSQFIPLIGFLPSW